MGSKDLARLYAELQYLRQRSQQLENQLPDGFTEDQARILVDATVTALEKSSKQQLALDYERAFERFQGAVQAVEKALARDEVDHDAQETLDAALEDFERVGAEATAFLESLTKGGA